MTQINTTAPLPQSKAAKYRVFRFIRKLDSAWFECEPQLTNFKKVPQRLRVEETWQEHIKRNGAAQTCHDGRKDGEHEFFTGLLPVPNTEHIFVGNQYVNSKTSLCIFEFSTDLQTFTLYHFNNFDVNNRGQRFAYVRNFLGK